ncbi:hypothetical protein PybrP1_010835 [[Pythium] brassicae (nom. inval.)]|nr:hypothetical protein PybrP1_010835 [[Pythium] brassicae (nom. inval.)]
MVNSAPTVIDASESTGAMSWPTNGTTATKNIVEQFGRSCFKEFSSRASTGHVGSFYWLYKIPLTSLHPIFEKLTLTANCQLKLRLRINQGQFTAVGTGVGYTLKESIMSSGTVCPIMLASAEPNAPLGDLRLVTGTELSVAYGAISNAFTNTSVEGTDSAKGIAQYQSPMDSAPGTLQPGSAIRNFQVQIGGDNVFNNSKQYDFSSFAEEVSKLSAINGSLDTRLNCGLLNQNQWTFANRFLVADCSRMTHPDVPASVVVSGINAAAQGSDLLLLIVYERELEHDVLTGEVMRAD